MCSYVRTCVINGKLYSAYRRVITRKTVRELTGNYSTGWKTSNCCLTAVRDERFFLLHNVQSGPLDHPTSSSEMTNLWHACPKWQAESFPRHPAFTALQTFLFLLSDQRLYAVKNICIYTQILLRTDCI